MARTNSKPWRQNFGAELTAEYLRSILDYDPQMGIFIWKIARPKIIVGSIAGGPDEKGYIRIRINGRKYRAHRLVWLYMTGNWPMKEIDHRDLNKSNNRWNNLREATSAQNAMNKQRRSDNKSGIRGVHWRKDRKKWIASCCGNGKNFYATCATQEEASMAYAKAAQEFHGEFARTE